MIVNVPLNAIGEERPHVPHPSRCITKARILRARGERNLILCFLYTPNRPLSRSRASVLHVFTSRRNDEGRSGGRGRGGRATPASKRFHRAFMERQGWHSAEATRWLASTSFNAGLFCVAFVVWCRARRTSLSTYVVTRSRHQDCFLTLRASLKNSQIYAYSNLFRLQCAPKENTSRKNQSTRVTSTCAYTEKSKKDLLFIRLFVCCFVFFLRKFFSCQNTSKNFRKQIRIDSDDSRSNSVETALDRLSVNPPLFNWK